MTHAREYREVFLAHHGAPPYECYGCDDPMDRLEVVHHLDEDRSNNALANLVSMHDLCHQRLHHNGLVHTDETKARISASLKLAYAEGRRQHTVGAGSGNPFYGRKHSEEARAKMRAAWERRKAAAC